MSLWWETTTTTTTKRKKRNQDFDPILPDFDTRSNPILEEDEEDEQGWWKELVALPEQPPAKRQRLSSEIGDLCNTLADATFATASATRSHPYYHTPPPGAFAQHNYHHSHKEHSHNKEPLILIGEDLWIYIFSFLGGSLVHDWRRCRARAGMCMDDTQLPFVAAQEEDDVQSHLSSALTALDRLSLTTTSTTAATAMGDIEEVPEAMNSSSSPTLQEGIPSDHDLLYDTLCQVSTTWKRLCNDHFRSIFSPKAIQDDLDLEL